MASLLRNVNFLVVGSRRFTKAGEAHDCHHLLLDTIKVQAAAKRKAAILAVGANKRAALGQGAKAAAAAEGGPGAGAGAAEGEGGEGCSSHNGYTVLYKFNEGYTNAVKRPVKMAELLGAKL